MPVIAFEGLDGVGKTTMAEAVAHDMGGAAVTSALLSEQLGKSWRTQRQIVNKGDDADVRFNYFKALNNQQMRLARAAASRLPVATLDTSIYRTVATHRVLGSVDAYVHRFGTAANSALEPDYTFYLDLPEEERRARLIARDGGIVYSSNWDAALDRNQDRLRVEYSELELPTLDATLAVSALVDIVKSQVRV